MRVWWRNSWTHRSHSPISIRYGLGVNMYSIMCFPIALSLQGAAWHQRGRQVVPFPSEEGKKKKGVKTLCKYSNIFCLMFCYDFHPLMKLQRMNNSHDFFATNQWVDVTKIFISLKVGVSYNVCQRSFKSTEVFSLSFVIMECQEATEP